MEKRVFNFIKNMLLSSIVMAAVMCCALSFTACTEDDITGEEHEYVEGVTLPANTSREVRAEGGRLTVSFTTKAGYTISYDNKDMIKSATPTNISEATKAGNHSIKIEINPNTAESDRSATIYITVEGYVRTELIEIKQTSKAQDMDNITTWLDEILRTEYYWLDEYNEKWATFNFKVEQKTSAGYNNMLYRNLGGMTTNIADGGVLANDTRYIYTYMSMASADEGAASTRSSESAELGYGFDVLPILIGVSEENGVRLYGISVNHVYPNSPAATSGLRRSDIITKVNNTDLTYDVVEDIYNNKLVPQMDPSITLEKMDMKTKERATITLQRAEYEPNPVAYSGILEPSKEINPSGKKIGYLAYMSFNSDFDTELIDAMKNLANKGAEEFILDLRSNSGGAVVSAYKLASMMIDESYVGQPLAKLVRNPKNKYGNSVAPIVKYDESNNDLPNLNMQRVYVLVSEFTASASEMIITGLDGLDVEVITIGYTTEGKNCGMDVHPKTIGKYECTFAPITFLNFNAKDFNDYADGLTPTIDFEKYLKNESVAHLKSHIQWYPLPLAPWGNTTNDIAIVEAIKNINGDTLFKPQESEGDEGDNENSEGDESEATRSTERYTLKADKHLINNHHSWKRQGAYITDQDRATLQTEKQSEQE